MNLLELFTTNVTALPDYREIRDTPYEYNVRFTIGGKRVDVLINRDGDSVPNFTFEFDVNGTTKLTGGGSEIAIFSAVVQVLVAWLERRQPHHVIMSGSNEEGRGPLYRKLLQRVVKQLPHYRLVTIPPARGEKYQEFELKLQ